MRHLIIDKGSTLYDAIESINKGREKIAVVLDSEGKLKGILTDGDVRRALLNGAMLNDPIEKHMTVEPHTGSEAEPPERIQEFMLQHDVRYLPIVTEDNRLVRVEVINDLLKPPILNNPVFLFAGGYGRRLLPMTEEVPKPMLKVGSKPILQEIIESFVNHGLTNIYVSVHYKSGIIRDYFGNGNRFGADITYVNEDKPLGTAGALGTIKAQLTKPTVVMNGDILTDVNFSSLIKHHVRMENDLTVCTRTVEVTIPYGVIESNNQQLVSIDEKPVHSFNASAGIYILNPLVLTYVRTDEYLDMPNLIKNAIDGDLKVGVFPIHEYWIDIGRKSDFDQAIINRQTK